MRHTYIDFIVILKCYTISNSKLDFFENEVIAIISIGGLLLPENWKKLETPYL